MRRVSTAVALVALATFVNAAVVSGQTQIKLPKNKYTPEQDVQIGRKAAAEVRQQYPIINDESISVYLTKLGDRLVAVAPAELNQKVYEYSFTPVNLKDINAFALPGGPMFVQRGMFDAAASEGEVVGVMAHELSHVLLRHGTANATKAENPWLQLGQLAGALGGAVVGGAAGSAIAQTSQLGLGTLLLRYSREFEKQADLLGAQLMAKAGYDPRALAHMFETIATESGGSRDPQWMSSHPDPGNRTAYITKEAEALTLGPAPDTSGFETVKAKFAALPAPKNPNARNAPANAAESGSAAVGTPGQPVPPPSGQFRNVNGGVFQASIPGDWTPLKGNRSVKFVPQNGYGQLNGQTVFTHGVEFGLVSPSSRDLQQATSTWLNSVAESNPDLRKNGDPRMFQISQRSAIETPLSNKSPLGGGELVNVYTTFLVDGTLFYYLTVVPEADAQKLQPAFRQIGQSIRLTDAR
ncbi:MAG TPA: M48 family metallopeptidase [Vicinamibacterales bacterium]